MRCLMPLLLLSPWMRGVPGGAEPAAAVAADTRDGLAQWLYLHNAVKRTAKIDDDGGPGNPNPWELAFFDPTVVPTPPDAPGVDLPLAQAYREEGGLLVSRTNWDMSRNSDAVIVYGKHGREHNHAHHDAGTLAVDRGTRRLIRDIGTLRYPSHYGGQTRPRYYNDAPGGHNIVTFGDDQADPLGGMKNDGRGKLVSFDASGETTQWSIDLSPAYREGRRVMRRVVHVLPSAGAVADAVRLGRGRWGDAGDPRRVRRRVSRDGGRAGGAGEGRGRGVGGADGRRGVMTG